MSAVKNVGTWLIKSQLDIVEYKTFFIQGPVLFIPRVFEDDRGFFVETFKKNIFTEAIGLQVDFVQDNQSFSKHAGIIRGLHYQSPPHAQGKLIRCTSGSIIDIAVDARKNRQPMDSISGSNSRKKTSGSSGSQPDFSMDFQL